MASPNIITGHAGHPRLNEESSQRRFGSLPFGIEPTQYQSQFSLVPFRTFGLYPACSMDTEYYLLYDEAMCAFVCKLRSCSQFLESSELHKFKIQCTVILQFPEYPSMLP